MDTSKFNIGDNQPIFLTCKARRSHLDYMYYLFFIIIINTDGLHVASHPEILLVTLCYRNQYKLRPDGTLGLYEAIPFTYSVGMNNLQFYCKILMPNGGIGVFSCHCSCYTQRRSASQLNGKKCTWLNTNLVISCL